MRPVIFASLGLALGTASLSSYAACTTRDEYDQTINRDGDWLRAPSAIQGNII